MPPSSAQNKARAKADPIVRSFASRLRRRLGYRLRELQLFGSRAHGDAQSDSDYDMLVVVDKKTAEIRSEILDLEVALMNEYGVLVTSIVKSEEEWRGSQGFPLARNILQEGVRL